VHAGDGRLQIPHDFSRLAPRDLAPDQIGLIVDERAAGQLGRREQPIGPMAS
jgi:hypothetical protein